jgi:hypothetical protein
MSNRESLNSPIKQKNDNNKDNNYEIHIVKEVSENKETSYLKKKPENFDKIDPIKFPFSIKEILNEKDENKNNINKNIPVKLNGNKNEINEINNNSENRNLTCFNDQINCKGNNNVNKNKINCSNDYNTIPEIDEIDKSKNDKKENENNKLNLNNSKDNSFNFSFDDLILPKELKSIYDKKKINKEKKVTKPKLNKTNKENKCRNAITVSMNVNKIKTLKRGISTDTYNYYPNNKSLSNSTNRGISPQEFHLKLFKTKGKESLNNSIIKPKSANFLKLNVNKITYCPRIHPERVMKKWGEVSGKNWYKLSPNSRFKANEEMNQMIKDGKL